LKSCGKAYYFHRKNLGKKMHDYYVHDIDPFIVRFPFGFSLGPLEGLSWYGTMYLLGFIVGYFILKKLSKENFISFRDKDHIWDFITYLLFGVMIGGRLGHILFYQPEIFWDNPLNIFKVWEGGMASHGGIIGVIFAIFLFSKKNKMSFIKLLDSVSIATLPGLGFGRIGNFINGEMPGKVTDVSWAVIFPKTDMLARHPSQIYQALGEGLFLFLILWFVPRHKVKSGFLFAMFFILYPVQRIITETFRMESHSLASEITNTFTQGQVLSFAMLLIGLGIMYTVQFRKKEM
jgi:phosphatidylglycerol:prolipoprotein diacylglycerol transferase